MNVCFFISRDDDGKYIITDDMNRCYGIFSSEKKANKKFRELKNRYY